MARKTIRTKPLEARKPRAPPKTSRTSIPLVQRIQIVEDKKLGLKNREIGAQLRIHHQTVGKVFRRVMNRSCELGIPVDDPLCYKDDTSTKGRKRVLTEECEEELVLYVASTRETRKKTAAEHINELDLCISISKFEQVMYDHGYSRGKAGWKLYLNDKHKRDRKEWCQRYRFFDWKNGSASSDETPLRTAEQDGGTKWRKPGEELHPNVKNTTDQSYDKSMGQINAMIAHSYKSELTFIWTETEDEKKAATKHLRAENDRLLPWNALLAAGNSGSREQEEIDRGKRYPGPKPSFQAFLKNGQILQRGDRSKGGIDWYIYWRRVLDPKIYPQMQLWKDEKCEKILIEDNAGNHNKNDILWTEIGLRKFRNWPPRSPDLNPIEKAWKWCRNWLRRHNVVFKTREQAEYWWKQAWSELPQSEIDRWFEELGDLLQKCIDDDGDNNFQG